MGSKGQGQGGSVQKVRDRARAFCEMFHLEAPILMAPMGGASPAALAAAVANGGGMGGCGAVGLSADAILAWARAFRAGSDGAFQMNTWVPDAAPERDRAHEARLGEFLAGFGPRPAADAAGEPGQDFHAQCEAMLAARPAAVSSVMGLYPPAFVERLRAAGIAWFATVTTVRDALSAQAAGATALIVQGAEAGGHRGSFAPQTAERELAGLFGLLPAISDRVTIPVIASGGIGDGRGIAAAMMLGASAVSLGSVFLRCTESEIPRAWKDALAITLPEDTIVTRAFSGRAARALVNDYVRATLQPDAPEPAPYPVQRNLTEGMSRRARETNDMRAMYALGGESSAMARCEPAAETVKRLWAEASELMN